MSTYRFRARRRAVSTSASPAGSPGRKNLSAIWRQLLAGENAVIEGLPGAIIGRTKRENSRF